MGADGGVCWVDLRPGAHVETLQRLLAPWWYELTYLGSRTYADSRNRWIDEHQEELPNAVFGGYGTDLYDTVTWRDLSEWVREVEDAITDPARGFVGTPTFQDLLDEIDTRPPSWWSTGEGFNERWESLLRRPAGAPLLTVPLGAWVEGVRTTLTHTDADHVSTWT
jgi:hypothetical protein